MSLTPKKTDKPEKAEKAAEKADGASTRTVSANAALSAALRRVKDKFNEGVAHRLGDGARSTVDLVVPTGIDAIDYHVLGIGGLPCGRITEVYSDEGSGKAQPLDAPVLTPRGFVPIGTLKVGDTITGADGGTQTVVGVFPRGVLPVYRVTTTDGGSTRCCDEHLWRVQTGNDVARGTHRVLRLNQFMDDLRENHGKAQSWKYHIPRVAPVRFEPTGELPLDPYLLGLLLGDGGFTGSSAMFSKPEEDLCAAVAARLPPGDTTTPAVGGVRIVKAERGNDSSATVQALAALGLWGLRSEEKFVPTAYATAAPEARLALLRGLFDTDGSVASAGRVDYSSSSRALALAVVDMVRSLGGLAAITERTTTYMHRGERKAGLPSYRVSVQLGPDMVPVASAKNLAKWAPKAWPAHRSIAAVEYLGDEECVCIKVSNPDELYVTDDFIVTHNSSFAYACIAGCQRAGGIAIIADTEHSLDPRRPAAFGVKIEDVGLIQPDCMEDFLAQLEIAIEAIPDAFPGPRLVVWDSLAATPTRREVEEGLDDKEAVGERARILSHAMRVLGALLTRKRVALLVVNQLRCVAPDTLVFTDRGMVRADAVRDTDRIVGRTGRLEPIHARATSHQDTVRVTTRFGYSVTAGKRHPVLTMRGGTQTWVMADDLRGGDWVALAREVEMPEDVAVELPRVDPEGRERAVRLPTEVTDDFATLLGMWFADGSLFESNGTGALSFTEKDADRRRLVAEHLDRVFGHHYNNGAGGVLLSSRHAYRFLRALGLQSGAHEKTVPACIGGRRQWRAFLRGMLDTHVTPGGFAFSVSNPDAARAIHTALRAFGVVGALAPHRTGWTIRVLGADAARYLAAVGFIEPNKTAAVAHEVRAVDPSARGKLDVVPGVDVEVRALCDALRARGVSVAAAVGDAAARRVATYVAARGRLNLAWRDLDALLDAARRADVPAHTIPGLLEVARERHLWLPVQSVEDAGAQACVDFDVPASRSFVAGGIVTHNTKIGVMYGDPDTTPGGKAMKYHASVRIKLYGGKSVKNGTEHTGKLVTFSLAKSRFRAPFAKVQALLDYNKGWDNTWTTLNHAKEEKLVPANARGRKAHLEALEKLGWTAALQRAQSSAATASDDAEDAAAAELIDQETGEVTDA